MSNKEVRISAVEHHGTLFSKNKRGLIGQDGAYSMLLPDGSSFWSFGDTLLGPGREGYDPRTCLLDKWLQQNEYAKKNVGMVSNTAGITRGHISSLLDDIDYIPTGGKPGEIIAPDATRRHAGNRYRPFWPMDGICVDGKLYLFYIMVDCGTSPQPGVVDINVYGTGIALAEAPWQHFTRLESGAGLLPPSDPANAPEASYVFWNNERDSRGSQVPDFGVAVLKRVIDGQVYIYGSRVVESGKNVRHEVCVARVPVSSIGTIQAWRYWTGRDWGTDPSVCASVFTGNSNELSVSWNPYLAKYVTFYGYAGDDTTSVAQPDAEMGQLRMRSADFPEGPWSADLKVCDLPQSLPGDYCYAGKEHPEFQEDGGRRTWVTFVSHQRYFPELLRVDFV